MANESAVDWVELERLIKKKGGLHVVNASGGGMGLFWSVTLGGEWPWCSGGTLEWAFKNVISTHLRLEREELAERINEIDASAAL